MTRLEHLGRAVLGLRYSPSTLFTMLTCYLDEAGGEQDGHTTVCGWISTVALWEQFEIDWKLFLASYKVPYFHMAEFSQSTGPFKKWDGLEKTRTRFLVEGIDIIKSRAQAWLVCFVHHKIFELIKSKYRIDSIPSPYAIAGRACVARVDEWSNRKSEQAEFVFEDGGPDKGGLLTSMDLPVKLPGPIFKPSRDQKDRKTGLVRPGIVQLQAADMLAYELRKHRVEFAKRSKRPVRKSLYSIIDMMPRVVMGSATPGNILDLCRLESLETL